ncbi:hypothetical protein [Salinisphaera sp. G21_0]|uniref:hypothetical protein n=1 Tax=Salinisphaera sp. G21_0 TaxID=2821094 RepID=UPI001ADA5F23|nr:hypothetical protein [Salinisphaera sp. G21_0]MBO9484524.1 hypothetical protein [Salinisphaera sp. G21_0]
MAFISLLDDRARPKGSRDPLGFELIWTHFGRQVVGNLTTITSSLENFTVALLGFCWANELAAQDPSPESQAEIQKYFLRYEQMAAYLRFYQNSGSIMGKNRVARRIADQNTDISIDEKTQQILSNQTSYGLWGLYSSALRDTGLIKGNKRQLTASGMEIIALLEARLDKCLFIDLLTSSSVTKQHLEAASHDFLTAINHPDIQQTLLESLLLGSGGNRLQQELWLKTRGIIQLGQLPDAGPDELPVYLATLFDSHPSPDLQRALKWIIDIERILTATNNIFHYCRMKDGESIATIIQTLEDKQYGYGWLVDNLNGVDFPRKAELERILLAFKQGNYREAIQISLLLNKEVMSGRGGAPWVELAGDKLRVTVKSETASLAENGEALQKRWDYEYFLKSYLRIARHYQHQPSSGRLGV